MDLGAESLFKPLRRGSSSSVVRLVPPSKHLVPTLTGGLKRLYQKIKLQEAVIPHYSESYTDDNECFCPVEGMPLLADRYEYVEVIGQGQSSLVLKAKDTFQGGRDVAIKILHTSYSILGSQEASCLRSLNSADPHEFSPILRLLNTFSVGRHFCFVFELLHCVPLERFFQEDMSPLERLRCVRKVALRLINAIGFLQSQNIIHADLKPDNLHLCKEGDLASLKVVDFGNAIHCIHDELSLYYDDFELQTLSYRAPEVIFGMMFGVEVDIWSVGCILAELYLGKPLFQGKNVKAILTEMQTLLGPLPREIFQRGKFFEAFGDFTKRYVKPVAINDVMKHLECSDFTFVDFLLRLLKFDPGSRMTVGQAAEHPFLAAELGLKFFQMTSSYESNVGYPKTFLTPEIYRHSLKQSKQNSASDQFLTPSALQNLEELRLPLALKFLPRKINSLNSSGILSKPDMICGLRSGEKSNIGSRSSSEKLETNTNSDASFRQVTIKIEPDDIESSTITAETAIVISGPGLKMEMLKTDYRSTEKSGPGLSMEMSKTNYRSTEKSGPGLSMEKSKTGCRSTEESGPGRSVEKSKTGYRSTEKSGPGLSVEISRTGYMSTKRSGLDLNDRDLESEEHTIVSSALSDANKGAKATINCEFQRRRLNFDQIQNLSDTECVPVRDHSDFDQNSDGLVASNRTMAKTLDAKDNHAILGASKHDPVRAVLVHKNDHDMLSKGLDDGICKRGQGWQGIRLLKALLSKKLPENESHSGMPSESLQDVEDTPLDGTFIAVNCELSLHSADSQPVLEDTSPVSSRIGRQSYRPTSQSEEDLRKVNGSSSKMETVPDRERIVHTSLSHIEHTTVEFRNLRDISKAVADVRAAPRTASSFLNSNVVLAEEPGEMISLLDARNVGTGMTKPTLNIQDVWQSLIQKRPVTKENSSTVNDKKKSPVEERSAELGVRTSEERSEQISHKLDSSGAKKQMSCNQIGTVNSKSEEVLGDDDNVHLHPARLSSSRKRYRWPTQHLPSTTNGSGRLELCEGQEKKASSVRCAGQISPVCEKKPSRNSQLDSTFIVEVPQDAKRVQLITLKRMPHQMEKMMQSETTDTELPHDSSSCRENAPNTSHCLNVTFSRSKPHDDSGLEIFNQHKSLSSTDSPSADSPVINSCRTNCITSAVVAQKVTKLLGFGSLIMNQNDPKFIGKNDTKLMQHISSSDSTMPLPKKRQKMHSETMNQTTNLLTQETMPPPKSNRNCIRRL